MVSVGIIGLGFVGGSAQKSFTLKGADVKAFDKYKDGGIGSIEDLLPCQIVFLCLPTLYSQDLKAYDKSAIREVCGQLEQHHFSGLVVVKSTVEPETTNNLTEEFPLLRIAHNPEFLTARTAFEDFHNQDHIVLGKGPRATEEDMGLLCEFYVTYYPEAKISMSTAVESESMKIMCNSFYASKVMLFNEYFLLCQKNGADFEKIRDLMLANNWINPMHTLVPGPDAKLGYGGACFPKDTNALCNYMKSKESTCKVLDSVIEERNMLRDDNTNVISSSEKKIQKNNNIKNKKVLVTGGAGFVGSNIVETLLENNQIKCIRILDNLATGKMENIQFLLDKYGPEKLEFMYGDIANFEVCRKAVKDMDLICHQAALGSVPRSVKDPLPSHMANVNGFLHILVAANEVGIKRVVYASSSSVYGDHPVLPKVEENTGNVLSPYAATKAIDEIYASVFTRCYNMECIGLRYFNIFGPRQDPNGAYAAVIPKFIKLMREGKQPTINGDGTYSRDFTYVDNAVQANILALSTQNKECFGEAFNIGAGGQTTITDLVKAINLGLNTEIEPILVLNRPGDIPHSNADISKAKRMLGYNPQISFEDGIEKLINCKKNIILNNSIESINFSKLLNRSEIKINNIDEIKYLNDKTILVTGGFGSIGSEIVRQLLPFNVKIIIYDNNECNYFYLSRELLKYKNITYILGSINDYNKVNSLFITYKIDLVYHAAAYKHVPILETNEYESIKLNVIGVKNIADLSIKYNVEKFIFVSTDKAVNPTNIMGCCKRISEMYISFLWNKFKSTHFITTRFGNVLGSSGSVLPTFLKNIKNNKNLTVTHKDITRYFMSIPEAAKLVLLSSCICFENNKVLFDMGEPIKIYDFAKNLLNLVNRTDLDIEIVGLRQGEKLYEELYYNNETCKTTKYKKIILLETEKTELPEILYNKLINMNYENYNSEKIRVLLKKIVPEYNYNE